MKQMSTVEKMKLLEYHGAALNTAFQGIRRPTKADLLEHAQRAIEIIKSIPKLEFGIED